jgi:hypothetical protein
MPARTPFPKRKRPSAFRVNHTPETTEHPGPATDGSGNAAFDPTANVNALFAAGNERQDDLRIAEQRFNAAEISHVKEIVKLNESHSLQMSTKESSRLDSVRQVDVLAGATNAERTLEAVKTLAQQTAANADNLSKTLTSTAAAVAEQFTRVIAEITTRIAAVERSQYEGVGKAAIADPAMKEMVDQLKALTSAQAERAGKATVSDPAQLQLLLDVKNLLAKSTTEAALKTVSDPALLKLAESVAALVSKDQVGSGFSAAKAAMIGTIVAVIGFLASAAWMVGNLVSLAHLPH